MNWRIRSASVVVLAVIGLPAQAGTALEARINAEAMPHLKLGPGDATVHYTRMRFQRSEQTAAEMLKVLRKRIDSCVADYKRAGKAVKPPEAYPDMTLEYTVDTYWAANRAISYQRGYFADVDAKDCGLRELETHTARLASVKGSCQIDLIAGSSRGVCDAGLHAAAPARAALRNAVSAGVPLSLPGFNAADPKVAAALARAQKAVGNSGPTGVKKTIGGVACDVWAQPNGVTQCATRAGKLAAPAYFDNLDNIGLVLEIDHGGKLVIRAEQAQFDVKVSADVFAPHAGGGFAPTGSTSR